MNICRLLCQVCLHASALTVTLGLIAPQAHSLEPVAITLESALANAKRSPEATAKLSVRQSGVGKEPGLLNDMKGPAALLDVDFGNHRDFRSIAGAVDGPGGQKLGYVAGTGSFQPSTGTELRVSYIGDERGGAAIETRIARSFEDLRFTLSSTLNRGFESKFTGTGPRTTERAFEGGMQVNAFSQYPLGAGLRATTRVDGSSGYDLLTLQMMPLGRGRHWLMNTTATPLTEAKASSSGTLMYYGGVGALDLTAELDYAAVGRGVGPTEIRLTAEKNFANGWYGFVSASETFSVSAGRFDVGASRNIGGFVASASAGTTFDGSGYVGVRIFLPLSSSGQDGRWYGFADAKRRMQQDAEFVGQELRR